MHVHRTWMGTDGNLDFKSEPLGTYSATCSAACNILKPSAILVNDWYIRTTSVPPLALTNISAQHA